jgi:hypothetical protein
VAGVVRGSEAGRACAQDHDVDDAGFAHAIGMLTMASAEPTA